MKELDNDFINDFEIGIATINGRQVYFTELRIPLDKTPEDFYRYEVRESDTSDKWSTIEERVVVNFGATILTDERFIMKPHPWFNPYTNSDGVNYYLDIDSYTIDDDYWDEDEPAVPEDWWGGYSKKALKGYEIVTWPDSQELFEVEDYADFCYLINDEEGLERFGSSAYVVDADWLKTI